MKEITPPPNTIRYDLITQAAMLGAIRTVLEQTVENGLPGDHHFYISINSRHPGVIMSHRLIAQYPEEITIVLQHRFWGLKVSEDDFEVSLSFSNMPETLKIPFSALKSFFDPSVQFGVQFDAQYANSTDEDASTEGKRSSAKLQSISSVKDQSGDSASDASHLALATNNGVDETEDTSARDTSADDTSADDTSADDTASRNESPATPSLNKKNRNKKSDEQETEGASTGDKENSEKEQNKVVSLDQFRHDKKT